MILKQNKKNDGPDIKIIHKCPICGGRARECSADGTTKILCYKCYKKELDSKFFHGDWGKLSSLEQQYYNELDRQSEKAFFGETPDFTMLSDINLCINKKMIEEKKKSNDK